MNCSRDKNPHELLEEKVGPDSLAVRVNGPKVPQAEPYASLMSTYTPIIWLHTAPHMFQVPQ